MPKCPECGRAMASVMRREGGLVRTYYECPACSPPSQPIQEDPAAADEKPPAGLAQDK